jgi:pimeloyl-ACP methyl ester carboxylesterase
MEVRNIVLVHGAWADGSSWNHVIKPLQADGFQVTSVQIALQSLEADVAAVRQVLAVQDGPTVVAGHSYGGAVVTQLGPDAANVAGLVFVSAFVPDEGESMKALVTNGPPPAGSAAIRPDPQGLLWLDRAGFIEFFAPDLDPDDARVLAAVQQPISADALLSDAGFGPPAWKAFPSWFVVSEDDQMLPPAAQHAMAGRAGSIVTAINGSHVTLISHAPEVARVIADAARAVSAMDPIETESGAARV